MRRLTRLAAIGAAVLMTVTISPSAHAETDEANDRHIPRVEELQLRCANVSTKATARIGCKWTAPEYHRVHHYRLWRANKGTERQVIWRGDTQGYRDPMVRRGVNYAYLVEAVNPHGRVVGRSNVDFAKVPKLERLEMACRAGVTFGPDDQRNPFAACKWEESNHDRAAGYKLRRIDSEGNRTTVFATRDLSHNSYVDHTVEWGETYVYRLKVIGGNGKVIGVGGPVKVHVGDA